MKLVQVVEHLKLFQGEQGEDDIRFFWSKKLPIGSGPMESGIRQVVNMRLKSAGMFWKKENSEGTHRPNRSQSHHQVDGKK